MITINKVKKHVLNITQVAIEKALGKEINDLLVIYPPDVKFGDLSIEIFSVVKNEIPSFLERAGNRKEVMEEKKGTQRQALKKAFDEIIVNVTQFISNIPADDIIEKVSIVGPYVNFKIRNSIYFGSIFSEVLEKDNLFGTSEIGLKQTVMVEYLSPNTNKPLHLGHLRNGSLGMSIARLLVFSGSQVLKSNLVNDRGVHICKSMLAWQKWGQGETPQSTGLKGDHFVGKWYVRYSQEENNNPSLADEIQIMLKEWEAGDEKIMNLWKKMNGWVYDGFAKTYHDFGLEFDIFYYESQTYLLGKDIIDNGLSRGVFTRDEKNRVVFFLPEEFGKEKDGQNKRVTVLRSDGTSVYITQDLGTAVKKVEDNNLDRSIYVVGSEQVNHFKCLFTVLSALGYQWAKNCYHLSYGMVYLPDGKMKSREGKVVDADNLIKGVEEIVSSEIKKRHPDIFSEELQRRAHIIAIGAIKFHLLRVSPGRDIYFDPKESVAIDGFTAPYCQYTYARSASILRTVKNSTSEINDIRKIDYSVLGNNEEVILAKKIMQLPEAIEYAVKELDPSRIATQVFEIAQAFNQFYNKHRVLNAEDESIKKTRIALVQVTLIAIRNGLTLLGIETVEEM
ncbi:arginine--tRNA ligase [Candidatus Azambacteria bacterium]|nr:arginine--tRNA ligase [Candidatus Azambacteria bacterium]